jgi:hypothetical protein
MARPVAPPVEAPKPPVPQLRSEGDVQAYLGDVEQRLRRSGQLSATEIQPAFEAINRAAADVGPQRAVQMRAEFAMRLNRLAAEQAH